MALKENDFVSINFTGKVHNGEVFDSNVKEELAKLNSNAPAKEFIFKLGKGMFLKGIDKFLVGKDVGTYDIMLAPEEAFGLRDPKKMQIVPLKVFHANQLRPIPGMMFNFDGGMGKVLSVSGGRVRVDFNNPIAGKIVDYTIEVKEVVKDENKIVESVIDFLMRRPFAFEIKGDKVVLKAEKGYGKVLAYFKDQFKELAEKDLEIEEFEHKDKEESKTEVPVEEKKE